MNYKALVLLAISVGANQSCKSGASPQKPGASPSVTPAVPVLPGTSPGSSAVVGVGSGKRFTIIPNGAGQTSPGTFEVARNTTASINFTIQGGTPGEFQVALGTGAPAESRLNNAQTTSPIYSWTPGSAAPASAVVTLVVRDPVACAKVSSDCAIPATGLVMPNSQYDSTSSVTIIVRDGALTNNSIIPNSSTGSGGNAMLGTLAGAMGGLIPGMPTMVNPDGSINMGGLIQGAMGAMTSMSGSAGSGGCPTGGSSSGGSCPGG